MGCYISAQQDMIIRTQIHITVKARELLWQDLMDYR